MAESNGCAKALRSVTRGGALSTSSAELPLSNMRDWVATSQLILHAYKAEAKSQRTEVPRKKGHCARATARSGEFRLYDSACYGNLLLGGGFGCGVGVLLGEALDAAGGVHKLLLAGEEGMAVGADFDVQPVALDGGTRLKIVPASTVNGYGMIVGMNTGLHESPVFRVRSARLICGEQASSGVARSRGTSDYNRRVSREQNRTGSDRGGQPRL